MGFEYILLEVQGNSRQTKKDMPTGRQLLLLCAVIPRWSLSLWVLFARLWCGEITVVEFSYVLLQKLHFLREMIDWKNWKTRYSPWLLKVQLTALAMEVMFKSWDRAKWKRRLAVSGFCSGSAAVFLLFLCLCRCSHRISIFSSSSCHLCSKRKSNLIF